MERLHGVPLTDLTSIRSMTRDPEQTLITALNTWFGSVLGCETFHADVHAGAALPSPVLLVCTSVLSLLHDEHCVAQPLKRQCVCKCKSCTAGVCPVPDKAQAQADFMLHASSQCQDSRHGDPHSAYSYSADPHSADPHHGDGDFCSGQAQMCPQVVTDCTHAIWSSVLRRAQASLR